MDPLKTVATLDVKKQASSLLEEFKGFAFKGNVIDLAIGVIIGAAFGKIVSSLVQDIIMPLVAVLLPGDKGYEGWVFKVSGATIPFGRFIGELVNFLIVALVLFIFVVKFLGWIMRTKKEEAAVIPPLTKDQELLTEIRDLLRSGRAPAQSS
ncbi:MAG TPA: large conductance mechanosensitive channel protein MscL [Gemmataceae bacterium]|nr:large conductance mechanosensitive channel protein MscL [Gemmataceae bacterium]